MRNVMLTLTISALIGLVPGATGCRPNGAPSKAAPMQCTGPRKRKSSPSSRLRPTRGRLP